MTATTADPATTWAQAAEARVLEAAIPLAADCGWSPGLVARAAGLAGLSGADATLLLPAGPRDLAALLSRRHDAAALAALAGTDPLALKIRERIRLAVQARVEAAAAEMEAVKRCTAFLARPGNLRLGMTLLWESADTLWRWAGDTATDENHYSKRAILAGVLASSVAVRFERGETAAAAHLDARIANVMAFEKWKAGLPRSNVLETVAGALGRARYGAAEPVLVIPDSSKS